MATSYIACDLGAESGRVILGTLEDGRLRLEELHRFPTGPVRRDGTLRWDVDAFFAQVRLGLAKAGQGTLPVRGVSADSWGVDYAWRRGEELLGLPFQYRDARTEGGFARAFALVPQEEIYARTGIQFMEINTLYQLHADLRDRPAVLEQAEPFLPIGDYFNWLLGGVAVSEESLASTTQLYDPAARRWAGDLAEKLGLPARLFPKVVPSGTVLGPLRLPLSASGPALAEARVVASCSHDTAAAVAAIPAEGDDWAYLSSGTWSLLGIESARPFLGQAAREGGFTNELGHGGSVRFLKNLVGLWILQECRRAWSLAGEEHSYEALCAAAAAAPPLRSLINPDAPAFAKPGDMPGKIAAYCRATGQPVPETPGAFARCILESLALLYARTLENLESVTGRRVARLHIVGGGSRNELLNRLTAAATGRPVLAGPVEATAAGNILVQALALGDLGPGATLREVREVARASFPVLSFQPETDRAAAATWLVAHARFAALPSSES